MSSRQKAIVFGTGGQYLHEREIIHSVFEVVALADNNSEKHGTVIDGHEVIPPSSINEYEYDFVLVAVGSQYSLEIKRQLMSMGVPEEKLRFSGTGGIAPFTLNPRFFNEGLTYEDKRQLFSENVERVILELNSVCNRKCWFCTNAYVCNDRDNRDMSDEVFSKVLSELAEINYDRTILLSFFNEPLVSVQLESRIRAIKEKLPECSIYAFTNGDYLTRQRLDMLVEAGLDMLVIDIYTNDIEYNSEAMCAAAQKLFDKIGIELPQTDGCCNINKSLLYKGMKVNISAQDFRQNASNRAESLPDYLPIPKNTCHPKPCVKSFMSMHIDFRGDAWPCPNFHREYQPHRSYCLGSVAEQSIYEIYMGEKLMNFREQNFFHRSTLPCRSCVWNFDTFILNELYKPFRDRPSAASRGR